MAIKISGSTIIDDSRNIVAGLAATFTGNVTVGGTLTYEDVTNIDSVGLITARSGIRIGATGDNTLITGKSTGIGIGTNNPDTLLTLYSDAENEELLHFDMGSPDTRRGWKFEQLNTGTSTGLKLKANSNGKSFVIYASDDSQHFKVHTSASQGGYAEIPVRVGIADSIYHIGDDDTNIRFPAANTFSAETAGTERLRITSDGKIGIGTITPNVSLDIGSNSPGFRLTDYDSSAGAGTTSYTQLANINGNTYVYTRANENNGTYLIGGHGNGVYDEHVRITPAGDVGIGTGNPTGVNAVSGNEAVLAVGVVTATSVYGKLNNLTYPTTNGTDGQVLTSDGAGVVQWEDATGGSSYTNSDVDTHLNISGASSGQILSWNGSDYAWVADQTGGGGASGLWESNATGINTSTNVGIGTTTVSDATLVVDVGTASTAIVVQGSEGRLFSVTNSLTSGSIFSVNDITGIPSIDVDADGTIQLAPFGTTEYIGLGITNPSSKLHVVGGAKITGVLTVGQIADSNGSVGTAASVLSSTGSGLSWVAQSGGGTDLTNTANGTSFTIESSSGSNTSLPAATTSAWGVMTDEDKTNLDANTSKVTNATHTGDVTGATALTIADDKIEEKHINAGGTPGADKVLVYDSGEATNWKWADQSGSGGGGGASGLWESNATGINTSTNVGIGTTTVSDAAFLVDVGTASTAVVVQGSEGQLFSVTNSLSSGSIFSVNDISGVPSIDVDADGTIQLAPYNTTEYIGLGITNPTSKLHVVGGVNITGVITTGQIADDSGSVGTASSVLSSTGSGLSWVAQSGGASVANQADNRLISATGTTDALNAEANLTFDGTTLKVGTAITASSGFITATTFDAPSYHMASVLTRDKYRLWGNTQWTMGMTNDMTFGGLDSYAITSQVTNHDDRGWVFLDTNHTDAQGAMSLNSIGELVVAKSIRAGGGESDTSAPAQPLDIIGDGIISGDVGIGTNNPTGADALTNNTKKLAVGVVTTTSVYGKLNNLTYPTANGTDGYVLTSNGSGIVQWEAAPGAGGGISGITVQEEGSDLATLATTLNFVGDSVTASGTGATKTITISGGGGSTDMLEVMLFA